jgi:hypothetical protein
METPGSKGHDSGKKQTEAKLGTGTKDTCRLERVTIKPNMSGT